MDTQVILERILCDMLVTYQALVQTDSILIVTDTAPLHHLLNSQQLGIYQTFSNLFFDNLLHINILIALII